MTMSAQFLACFGVVLVYEGGYVNDPDDSGGETKYGISKAAYPSLDIANLTVAAAQAIYEADYWQPIRGDSLPITLALLVLDAAVNNGVEQASRWLQTVVKATPDGAIGPLTLAAVTMTIKKVGLVQVCGQFHAARVRFMAALPTWPDFESGWSERLASLPFQAMALQQHLDGGS